MKAILITLAILTSTQVFSQNYTISVENNSNKKVSFGYFKGIMVPSLCEDGFCFEEAFEKLRPLNRKFKNITKKVKGQLALSDFQKDSYFVIIEGKNDYYKQVEITNCEDLDSDSRHFYPEIKKQVSITESSKSRYCISAGNDVLLTVK